MLPVIALSTIGVVISAVVMAAGLIKFLAWPTGPSIVFGVLIAATDPIAVLAMFKDTGIKGRLRILVESESLFNDGVAAVLFVLALTWALATDSTQVNLSRGAHSGSYDGRRDLGRDCVRRSSHCARGKDLRPFSGNHTDCSHCLRVVSDRREFHFSGVLATVSAGLLMGNLGVLREDENRNLLSPDARILVIALWEFAAFIANSLIFLLIGLRVAAMPFTGVGARALSVAIGLLLVGRALTVYPICLLFRFSKWRIPTREQHILWWGGLRGALALALALALPPSLPLYNEILVTAFGVIVFSVVVQGLTMPWLLRKLGTLPME